MTAFVIISCLVFLAFFAASVYYDYKKEQSGYGKPHLKSGDDYIGRVHAQDDNDRSVET